MNHENNLRHVQYVTFFQHRKLPIEIVLEQNQYLVQYLRLQDIIQVTREIFNMRDHFLVI